MIERDVQPLRENSGIEMHFRKKMNFLYRSIHKYVMFYSYQQHNKCVESTVKGLDPEELRSLKNPQYLASLFQSEAS